MKITYINHSCFSVELDNCILLFDYFDGSIPKFDNNKKIYVFSSHSHHDHYNKSIFDLRKILLNGDKYTSANNGIVISLLAKSRISKDNSILSFILYLLSVNL